MAERKKGQLTSKCWRRGPRIATILPDVNDAEPKATSLRLERLQESDQILEFLLV